jgi:hypothetical protein
MFVITDTQHKNLCRYVYDLSLDRIQYVYFQGLITYHPQNPCGGGVEYLHREPASRKRRRNWTKKGRAIA